MQQFQMLLDTNIKPLLVNLRQMFIDETECDRTTKIQAAFFTTEMDKPGLVRTIDIAGLRIHIEGRGIDRTFLEIKCTTPKASGNLEWMIAGLTKRGFISTLHTSNAGDGQGGPGVGEAVQPAQAESTLSPEHLAKLRQNLAEHFSIDELRTLCFDMGIKHENLPADTLDGMARELVSYCERACRIPELVAQCRKLRPNVAWE